jgi:hypothetical protein
VADPQPGRNLSLYTQPTSVQRAVMRAAQHHQIVRIIIATLRAQIQVMQIDKGGIPTPRHHTPPLIAPEHFPTNRRWRALRRAPTLQSSSRNARFTTHAGVRLGELSGLPRLCVGVCDLSDAMHGAGRQCELIRIARVVADKVDGELVGDTRIGVGDFHMGARVGDTPVGVGAGGIVGDPSVDVGVGAGEFVGDIQTGTGLCDVAGIGRETVGRIRGDTVHGSDRDILRVAVTHLDDCRIELDQLAVRVLKAAPAVFTLGDDHLVTGAAGVARTAQDFTRHQQQRGVIIQAMVAPLLKLFPGF